MSVIYSAWVWKRSKASGNELLVLLALADQAHDTGKCWPSIKNIAHRCRCSERTVQRSIESLVELGELKVEPRYDLESHQTSNHYQIVPTRLHDVVHEDPGDTGDTPPGDNLTPPGDTGDTLSVSSSSSSSTQNQKKESGKWSTRPLNEQEVIDLCKELELPNSDAHYLWNHWLGNGFTVSGKPMKRWRQVVRSWKAAGFMPSQQRKAHANGTNGRTTCL